MQHSKRWTVLVAILGLVACGDDAPLPIDPVGEPPAGFAVVIPDTIVRDQAFTLSVTALDEAGLPETTWSGTVTLSTSGGTLWPATVALVNGVASVEVTLAGHAGAVTVRASYGAVQSDPAAAMVMSSAAPARLEIVPASALLTGAGAAQSFDVRAFDAQGAPTIAPQVTWTSNDPGTLTIDAGGIVTAQAAVGSGMIVASANGVESAPALVLIAQPAAAVLLLADSQIVSRPAAVDPAAAYEPGWQYRVRVRGTAPPAVGDVVIGTGAMPLAGRVVASSDAGSGETELTVELMPLNQLFADLRIDELIPMIEMDDASGAQPGRFDAGGIPPAYGAAMAEVKFKLGPFECKASGAVPSLDLPSPDLDIDPDLDLKIGYTNGLDVLAVVGTVSADAAYKPVFEATFEGSATCETVFKTFTIPANGIISLFYGVQVPLGIGFTLDGNLEIAEVGFDIKANATAEVELGVTCAAGACSGLTKFEMTRDGSLEFIAPDPSEQFRVQLGGHAFVFARPYLGSAFTTAGSFEFIDATAGLKQTVDLATTFYQVEDTAYASSFNLQFLANIGAGKDLQSAMDKLGKLLGTDLSTTLNVLEVDDTLATSPKGTFTITPGMVAPGDTTTLGDMATFTVDLDPVTYLGVSSVDDVEFFWKHENEDSTFTLGPGRPSCVDVESDSGQTTFECETDFLHDQIGEQTFHAFVNAKLFGVPLPLPLEIAPHAAAVVAVGEGCAAPPADLIASLTFTTDTAAAGNDVTEGLSYTKSPYDYGDLGVTATATRDTLSTARLTVHAEFEDWIMFFPADTSRLGEVVTTLTAVTGNLMGDTDDPVYERNSATVSLAGLVYGYWNVGGGDDMVLDEHEPASARILLGEWTWLRGYTEVQVERYRRPGDATASASLNIGEIEVFDEAGQAVAVTVCSVSGRQY